MSATVVTYNGVTIGNVTLNSLAADAEYDPSGVIQIGVRKRVSVSGWIQDENSADFVAELKAAQADLLVPRKALTITIAGTTWASIGASGGGGDPGDDGSAQFDAGSGPFPSNVTIPKMIGGKAAPVSLILEWLEPPEVDTDTSDPVILSHRFSQTFSIDNRERTTRQVSGALVLNGKFQDVNPDLFRHYVLPLELAGFQRQNLEFLVSEDGNTLVYRSVDVEGYRPYPVGILKADMQVSVSTVGVNATRTKQISLRVEADKYYPKTTLVETAWDLINARLTNDAVTGIVVTEDVFGSNAVSIQVTAQNRTGSNGRDSRYDLAATGLFRAIAASSGTLPANGRFRQVNAYGQALVRAAVQAMFHAPDDGSPTDSTDLASATVGRYSRTTNLVDTDGDGYKENFTDASAINAVDVTVAALPSDYDGTTLDLFLGDNDDSTDGDNMLSEDQVGATMYTRLKTTFSEDVIPNTVTVPIADPDASDRSIQLGSPRVLETHSGEMWRVGAQPEPYVPPILADTSRKYRLLKRNIKTFEPRPMADGATVEYGLRYLYVVELLYDPSDAAFTKDQSVTYATTGAATVAVYDGSQAIAAPYQPMIDDGYAVADADPSIDSGVWV